MHGVFKWLSDPLKQKEEGAEQIQNAGAFQMRIIEYGTGLAANQIQKEWTAGLNKLTPSWFNDTLTEFDCVVEFGVKKKTTVEMQMKQTTKYYDFAQWCRSDENAVIHLFPKEEKQEQKKKGKETATTTTTSQPQTPTLWGMAHDTAESLRSAKRGGNWILDALYKATRSVACVSQFSKSLLLDATKRFKLQLKTADLATVFVPLVGASWYVYIDCRLLKQTVKLAVDTKYYDPNNMNMPGKAKPTGAYTFVGLKYVEILSAAGSPDAATLSQLLVHPCDILNPGLPWPTRLWFMVSCLAESVRHPEWHLLSRIAIDLYGQNLLPWRKLVCEDLWAPQTHGAVDAMHYYKDKGEPRHDDWLYTYRCIALIVTWMMAKHQVEAPQREFEAWLDENLDTKLTQLAATVNTTTWNLVPNLSSYAPQIAPLPQAPVVAQPKPKTGMELFQERIALAQEHQQLKQNTAVLLQSAVRGFLARQKLSRLMEQQASKGTPQPSTGEHPQ
ncbi:calmodulin-binding protein [Hyalangium versicolor]|uniref:calmodulin-binding protein n=1 Tax=Hyalangium versicolor TaxID=2861190 RepID=UPI001CCF36A8|nr:calmodulin-binding protein [Hyalangium versicolor]